MFHVEHPLKRIFEYKRNGSIEFKKMFHVEHSRYIQVIKERSSFTWNTREIKQNKYE
jgi:hypothetical protein